MRGDSLNVLERDFLCLPGHHGKDIHLQSAETQSCIVLQLRAKALQHHIIAALSNGTEERGLPTIGVTVQTCSSGATSMTISCDQNARIQSIQILIQYIGSEGTQSCGYKDMSICVDRSQCSK